MRIFFAAVFDLVFLVCFVVVGRSTHEGVGSVFSVLGTLWPFLVGLVVGWVVLRVWRDPLGVWPVGVGVWGVVVFLGLGLRWFSGEGVAFAFVVVASLFTFLTLVGWRGVFRVLVR
ncbi:DUF3054 domain-containing protein [Actinomadura flavalba]|uniref:DUF3054 domain-containing protein n=1 Tax=Actinomadura flavalba TaxID=1120938 RepID=UPI0009DBC7F9